MFDANRRATQLENDKTGRIRALNDRRRQAHCGGRILVTSGIHALGEPLIATALREIAAFGTFDEGNDPHGEHDFGALMVEEHYIFWKIDYYDQTMTMGAPDPSNEQTCVRVLTVMLAEEY